MVSVDCNPQMSRYDLSILQDDGDDDDDDGKQKQPPRAAASAFACHKTKTNEPLPHSVVRSLTPR
jgi:hypothetical protein